MKYLRVTCFSLLLSVLLWASTAAAFDHSAWDQLLQRHVVAFDDGNATAVDYAGFLASRADLKEYLAALSTVSDDEFEAWPRDDQLAFLINVYNAWTVELILTAYPNLASIRDLGSVLRSPWKLRFIPLFGGERTLDEVEHHMIRGADGGYAGYDEPRIHFAVNCASIGCPALLPEAFNGAELERQLDVATRAFLSDHTRNRWASDAMEISSIFRWYRDDFERGWGGAHSLGGFLKLYADELGVPAAERTVLANEEIPIKFLKYDWSLNSIDNMTRE